MLKELFSKKLGQYAEVKVVYEAGVITLSGKAEGGPLSASAEIPLNLPKLAAWVKAKIPGKVDDMLIDLGLTAGGINPADAPAASV